MATSVKDALTKEEIELEKLENERIHHEFYHVVEKQNTYQRLQS